MGTTANQQPETVGYVQRAGNTVRLITEESAEVAYGHRGPIYPLVLLIIAQVLILTEYPVAASIPLVLLAIWVGGHGRN